MVGTDTAGCIDTSACAHFLKLEENVTTLSDVFYVEVLLVHAMKITVDVPPHPRVCVVHDDPFLLGEFGGGLLIRPRASRAQIEVFVR